MRLTRAWAAVTATAAVANAQNVPSKINILSPQPGSTVGVNGSQWMMDMAVEFAPPKASGTSAAASAPTTSTAPASGGGGSGGYGSGGYRRRDLNDDGIFPFLNSPNLTSFKPGPDPAAAGLVVLVNSSSDPTTNFAGVYQSNAITNSDPQGNILEAFFTWYLAKAGVGAGVNSEITAFFVKGNAPAKYTGDPTTDPNVLTNVAKVDFFINGDEPTTTVGPASMPTPLAFTIFSPSEGSIVGVNGSGWVCDLVVANNDPVANYFSSKNGVQGFYHDNYTDPTGFKPGHLPSFPGLVVLSNTSTLAGGNTTNLARLFQMTAVTSVKNNTVAEIWMTWFIGQPFAGRGQPSMLTFFYVNGTAPDSITEMPNNIISNVATVNFTLSSDKFAPAPTAGSGGKPSGAASTVVAKLGALLLAALAFAI